MNEHPSAISIIRTRLPYLDRGALSRAWLEALGLAGSRSNAARAMVPLRGVTGPGTTGRFNLAATVAESRSAKPVVQAAMLRRAGTPPVSSAVAKPRVRVRPLPRVDDARAAARTYPRVAVSQMTLALDGGRVQLVVRRRGDRLDLVALCAANRVEAVRRALAGVELELRGAHIRVASHVASRSFV